ncbi:MAG TPA: tRNA (adenosine(37)-N6)-threonylcarbamoyltransferase complex ATPase subunit type 1 TsaE [Bacteroidia bacterium]|jgi:tRNA threonylcarbamoyladenosine biosynthesis protein TsaE|nr:tRNA (adenosine(37)-N6)-threonylcarbamoyltransferase complex ATPase subunit type 1 TsaE [Bacteroidia bacterium]
MTRTWTSVTLEQLPEVAAELLQFASSQKIFCLHGEMGAGKTTFVKELSKTLGVSDEVQSPTFSIVNEYKAASGDPVFHFDFYRLKRLEEAYDIGYEDYVFSGHYCFIEWPEKVESLLNFAKADIFITSEINTRTITCRYE